jgi:hypothetical protein
MQDSDMSEPDADRRLIDRGISAGWLTTLLRLEVSQVAQESARQRAHAERQRDSARSMRQDAHAMRARSRALGPHEREQL